MLWYSVKYELGFSNALRDSDDWKGNSNTNTLDIILPLFLYLFLDNFDDVCDPMYSNELIEIRPKRKKGRTSILDIPSKNGQANFQARSRKWVY